MMASPVDFIIYVKTMMIGGHLPLLKISINCEIFSSAINLFFITISAIMQKP